MLDKILFVDTETVPKFETLEELYDTEPDLWHLWNKKVENSSKEWKWEIHAGLLPEFNKLVCISYGAYDKDGKINVKALVGDDEKSILTNFWEILQGGYGKVYICAFNGTNFDFPLLCKKFVKYLMPIPSIINTLGKKPWEVFLIDPYKEWQFGSFSEQKASLDLVCNFLGIKSSKRLMQGNEVKRYFYKNEPGDWYQIGNYCNEDVIALIKVWGRIFANIEIEDTCVVNPENVKIYNIGDSDAKKS